MTGGPCPTQRPDAHTPPIGRRVRGKVMSTCGRHETPDEPGNHPRLSTPYRPDPGSAELARRGRCGRSIAHPSRVPAAEAVAGEPRVALWCPGEWWILV